jgi:demethylmenaquinone methyltransferase/2-methoxy-6-polyprenyl-1,4-benzoquinol methylase
MSREGRPKAKVVQPSPLPPAEAKAAYVQEMFGRIALHYDRMNRLMTLGRDRAWRCATVAQALDGSCSSQPAGSRPARRLLDVATGTGDLALEALRRDPALETVGVDFTPQMLAVAQAKAEDAAPTAGLNGGGRLRWVAGDALYLPFSNASFDAVVTGFAMRNVVDIQAAFAEMARVTRPGGRVACLELARPRLPVFRQLYAFYFFWLVPLLGRLVAAESAAYRYLPHSLSAFLAPDELAAVMGRAGWGEVRYKRMMLGTVALHVGVRG